MTSVDRPWIWAQSGWMSRPIPAIIFTIPSGISRLPWVSSPWLWNFTPPFPRHGRATNTRGGGWRRGSRRARTVASGARRRRLWSLRAMPNSGSRPSCGGLRLDEQPRLDKQILTLAGDARASTVQASRVCGSNGFCFIGFWAVGVTDLPDGAVPLRADQPSACPNARPRAALRRRRPKCGADRGASRLVSTGGTTTSPSFSGCMFAPKILEMRCYRVWVTYRPGPLRRTGPGFSAKGKQWAQRKRGGSPPLPERSA